jgi:hypothetical protein
MAMEEKRVHLAPGVSSRVAVDPDLEDEVVFAS